MMIDKINISGNINQIVNIDLSKVTSDNQLTINLKATCNHCLGTGYLKQFETVGRFGGDPISRTSSKKLKCPYCNNERLFNP